MKSSGYLNAVRLTKGYFLFTILVIMATAEAPRTHGYHMKDW